MVHIQNKNINRIIEQSNKRKIVCFGAGKHLDYIFNRFLKEKLYKYIDMIIDNKEELWGKIKYYKEKEYPIFSFDELCKCAKDNKLLVIITSHWYINEIIGQMDKEKALDNIEVFIGDLLDLSIADYSPFEIRHSIEEKIPRIIHYCWFGKGKMSEEYKRYLKTWKQYCPDYEIKQWNETNYDVNKNLYMKQAYEKKMWAFVSDYARIDIIHQYGGIYLDCDVELLKSLDVFLGEDMYCGFEDDKHINLGHGFGAVAGHPFLEDLLQYYENLLFIDNEGKMNLTACPFYQTEVIKSYGILAENKFQKSDKIIVYPSEVFSPYSYWGIGKVTDKTYSIHHFSASWQNEIEKEKSIQWKIVLKKLFERIQMQ